MAGIRIENVRKSYGSITVVKDFSLDVADGEFVVLVGPSGCGKSTMLKILAGLEPASAGRVLIGGRDVTDLAPGDRDIAMVFQNYALYPHLTVRKNMGFGLKMRGMAAAEIERRVQQAAKILAVEHLLDRRPKALSGGQRQRVALGRAIVREPQAFLMDEPLSNLDAKLRVHTRAEISALHKRLGVTTIYVTHDQIEAMTMADRIVIMRDGEIQQIADPDTMFARPANLFVASFIGSPGMNILKAIPSIEGMAASARVFGREFRLPVAARARRGACRAAAAARTEARAYRRRPGPRYVRGDAPSRREPRQREIHLCRPAAGEPRIAASRRRTRRCAHRPSHQPARRNVAARTDDALVRPGAPASLRCRDAAGGRMKRLRARIGS